MISCAVGNVTLAKHSLMRHINPNWSRLPEYSSRSPLNQPSCSLRLREGDRIRQWPTITNDSASRFDVGSMIEKYTQDRNVIEAGGQCRGVSEWRAVPSGVVSERGVVRPFDNPPHSR